jgi:hypothetical protein
MKLIIQNIKQVIIITFILSCSIQYIFSQGTDINKKTRPGIFIGLSSGSTQSQIQNNGTLSVSDLISDKKNSFLVTIDIGYYFSRYFGLSSGIGFISYNTQLKLASYQNKFNSTDSENEFFEMRVSGSDISESQKISALSIPLCIDLRIPINKTMGFYVESGVAFTVPKGKNYISSGTFTFNGFYPAYNVVLENLPSHGFPNNKSSNTKGDLALKSFGLNIIASSGIDYIILKKIQIIVAIFYNKSLSNISDYKSPEKFQLSSDPGTLNSLMGGTSKASVSSLGLKIGLRYYLK